MIMHHKLMIAVVTVVNKIAELVTTGLPEKPYEANRKDILYKTTPISAAIAIVTWKILIEF